MRARFGGTAKLDDCSVDRANDLLARLPATSFTFAEFTALALEAGAIEHRRDADAMLDHLTAKSAVRAADRTSAGPTRWVRWELATATLRRPCRRTGWSPRLGR